MFNDQPDSSVTETSESGKKRKTVSYARHLGRELALLSLAQIAVAKSPETLELTEFMERSIRLVSSEAEDNLKMAGKEIEASHEQIQEVGTILEDEAEEFLDRRLVMEIYQRLERSTQQLDYAVRLLSNALEWPLFRTLAGFPDVYQFTVKVLSQYRQNSQMIDKLVDQVSPEWPLERMNSLDRDITRLAAGEMLYNHDTPLPVIINEAVELAKKYGTVESHRFVNGVLRNLLPFADQERKKGN